MFRKIGLLIVGIVLLVSVAPVSAAEPETEAAQAAVDYIISLQNADGGFPAFGADSAPGSTIDAVFALVAAGVDVESVTADGNSPMDYLETQAAEYSTDPGAAAKLALALLLTVGPDANLSEFGGTNMVAVMNGAIDETTGMYGLDTFDHVFVTMIFGALVAGQLPAPPEMLDFLTDSQLDDGGWEFGEGFESDSNTTAMALQALLGAGVAANGPSISSGLSYLHTVQNADGGFGFLPDSESDPNSTGVAIQALAAAAEDIDAGGPWASGGVTPLEALLAFQNPETGAFQFAEEDSPFATYQVVPGLLLLPFPALGTPLPRLVPDIDTPIVPPHGDNGPVVPPADLPNVGTGTSSSGSLWLVAALAAGGLAAIGLGTMRRERRC